MSVKRRNVESESIFFYIGYAIPYVFVGGIIAVIGYYVAKRIRKRN